MFDSFYRKNSNGFTLIELMIVIAIIGILAAIAIPQFTAYRRGAYNTEANTDIKNAYTAAVAYFVDNPAGNVTLANLEAYGYKRSTHVTATVVSGAQATLAITTIGNANGGTGTITYTVAPDGTITQS
jgi:type IV pilus assembly protein PilA